MVRTGIGVDWAGGRWVVVAFDGSAELTAAIEETFGEVWSEHGGLDSRIAVDTPIGLLSDDDDRAGERVRECDAAARSILGGARSSSVFNAPSREAVDAVLDGGEPSHSAVSEVNRGITGKGLSIQSFNIIEPIGQVDRFLRSAGGDVTMSGDRTFGSLVESHPELCFRAFAEDGLAHSKLTASGFDERLDALDRAGCLQTGAETAVRTVSSAVADDDLATDVADDDLLDALVLAVTAAGDDEELHRVPVECQRDARGIPMEIVYRRDEPFEA